MRRFLTLLLMMLLLSASAGAVEIVTENGANGAIETPVFENAAITEAAAQALDLEEARALLLGGAELWGDLSAYEFALNGRQMVSLCFDLRGDIRFGRFDARTHTALIDAETGEMLGLDAVFADLDALQTFLDIYVEENVLDTLNAYLDANELLPVPLEAVSLDANGVTVHYPSSRFSYFSGKNGAISLAYYEMDDLLPAGLYAPPECESVLADAAQGRFCGLQAGEKLHEALAAYGTLTEPDFTTDGEIYEFESAHLRGVRALTARGAETDENAVITAIRSERFDLAGVQPGMARAEAIGQFGAPFVSVEISYDAAEGMRLLPGSVDVYPAGDFELRLYYDENDTVYAAEVGGAK